MNIFNVLSTGKSKLHEPSMSAMLAYLLNPNQDHGLGRIVINSFLKSSNKNNIYNQFIDDQTIKFEIDLEVPYKHEEKTNYIDIQIKIMDGSYNELHRIIIENKIRQSAANTKQLTAYYEAIKSDINNDNYFDTAGLEIENLSVIFLTPPSNNGLEAEFNNLEINNKVWLYWNCEKKSTIVTLIQDILKQEQEAKISPINEYMKHTLKAFTYYIIKTIDISTGKNRVGEDIGNIMKSEKIIIEDTIYTIIKRDSGQIQLFDQDGDKIVARPLLITYLKNNNIYDIDACVTTRCFGNQIIKHLEKEI